MSDKPSFWAISTAKLSKNAQISEKIRLKFRRFTECLLIVYRVYCLNTRLCARNALSLSHSGHTIPAVCRGEGYI